MKIWNIDYKATEGQPVTIISVKGYDTEELAGTATQGDDVARLIARNANDIASLGEPIQLALATKVKMKEPAADAEAIWTKLNPPPKVPKAKGNGPKVAKDNSSDQALQSGSTDGTSSAAGEIAGNQEGAKASRKKGKMATKKKAAKKKAAKKNGASTGPRGEKTLKVKALLERKSGCTRDDILEATGWPAVSVPAMAEACGLKLRKEKVEKKGDVRSHTRYFGS